jgi:hypothetical protein
MKSFIFFTSDHSELALAIRVKYEGYKVKLAMIKPWEKTGKIVPARDAKEAKEWAKRMKYLDKNGSGLVEKVWASDVVKTAHKGDGVYYIFGQIYGSQYAEALRRKGCKVLGGLKIGYELETNRDDTLALLKGFGLDLPEQEEFGKGSAKKAIDFLKKAQDKILYVLKSDNPSVVTQVACDSNDELIAKLEAEGKLIDTAPILLQQKVEGVEIACETWMYNGEPLFGSIDIEEKRKYNSASEVQTGCSWDIVWPVPLDNPIRERMNAPMDKWAAKNIVTGLYDLSAIYDHKEDKYYALEVCGNRFGYNSVFTLLSLLRGDLGEFLSDYLDGKLHKDSLDSIFMQGYGTSVRIFNDEIKPDQIIDFPPEMMPNVWLWDCYEKNDQLMTVGEESTAEATAIITAQGENPEGSFENLRKNASSFHLATKWYRSDFQDDDEQELPLSRFHQLEKLKLI